jgi:glucose dehydrogenase
LSEITPDNAAKLVAAYAYQTGVLGTFETSPIVSFGTIYISTPYDGVAAIDAGTGEQIWKRPPLSGRYKVCCGPASRGLAVARGLVVLGQLDGVLIALDRYSGELRWAKAVADNKSGYSITMAPLIVGDSIIVGVAGSAFGIRGWLSSYRLSDGALRWRWYTTDPVHWFGSSQQLRSDRGRLDVHESRSARKKYADSWKRGGGGIWTTPAFDSASQTVIVTTGNPWPAFSGRERPGDNLFTDSIVALDFSKGTMRWYYQVTPHDTRDHDLASPAFLFETVDRSGRPVHAVGEAAKDGYLYILNRDTGALIRRSENLVESSPAAPHSSRYEGGTTWSPVSFDPRLSLAIVTSAEHLRPGESLEASRKPGFGTVSGVDVRTGKIIWQDTFDEGLVGGSASTAGGVTFVGEGSGFFDALDTRTGRLLWRFRTGAGVNAPPVVFESGGNEYVAVACGGNHQLGTPQGDAVFVFRLKD